MNGSTLLLRAVAAIGIAAMAGAQEPGSISGRVVDVCGRPLAGAEVTAVASGVDDQHATCDEAGCFHVDGLPLRGCRIRASANGYYRGLELVELGARRSSAMVRLQLLESAAVQGRVVDADGAPVSNALVVFLAPEKFVGSDPGDHAWTDAAGRYRLPDVPLGEVCITVIATAYAPQNARLVVAGPATQDFQLHPGESASYQITISGASPEQWSELKCQLQLATSGFGADHRHWTDSNYRGWELGELWPHVREGDTLVYRDLPAELHIEEIFVSAPHGETEPSWLKVRGGRGMQDIFAKVVPDHYESNRPIVVRGTLRDPSGKPLPGRRVAQESDVAITDSEGAFALATRAFASGFFSLRLDEDDFVLHSGDVKEMGIYCHREKGLAALELVAGRSARVTGTVTDSAGAAVFDAEVELMVGPTTTVGRARTAHDGSFALDRLDARIASSLCLRVTSPGGKHTTGRWQLSPGQHLQVGNVAIPAAATIEGTIVDDKGKPRCGIQVSLFGRGEGSDLWHVYTDRLGRYVCSGLPAGDYSVNIDSPHSMGVEWPDYARVTVCAGERVVVTRGMSFPWPLLLAVAGALAILAVRAWRRRHRSTHASSD